MAKRPDQPLTPAALAVIEFAREILGDRADAWLNAPSAELGDATPMDKIRGYPGRIENMLLRLKDPLQL